jgi:cytochrome P450
VTDTASGRNDYDLFGEAYVADPAQSWARFRDECPVAHSTEYGGSWMPVRYDDVTAAARDVETFVSSKGVSVLKIANAADSEVVSAGGPPIGVDPPMHTWTRRLLLAGLSPTSVQSYEVGTRELCQRLVAKLVDRGHGDAAVDYAQQLPVRVIGALLGVPEQDSDRFVTWVRQILEFAHDVDGRQKAIGELNDYMRGQIADRRLNPGDDILSHLVTVEVEGELVPEDVILGEAALLLVAGVDTTWSAIGSSLYHLASHPEDRRRLVAEPELLDVFIEEVLRFYSPVTMGRTAATDTEFGGCPIAEGDRVLMNFPAANRDPDHFEDSDTFIIDRGRNRHLAFGVGIHRCAGSNLARMEMRVALEEWLIAIPEFNLADPSAVTWAGGQVRGPRSVPVTF